MEKTFNKISDSIYADLKNGEHLTLSLGGENSQFIRINGAKVRQTGLVNNADLSFDFIFDNRNCQGIITLSGDYNSDLNCANDELNRLRAEIVQLPEDPFIVIAGKYRLNKRKQNIQRIKCG